MHTMHIFYFNTYIQMHTYAYIQTHMNTCMHSYVCTLHAHIHKHVLVGTHVYYAYIHTYTIYIIIHTLHIIHYTCFTYSR